MLLDVCWMDTLASERNDILPRLFAFIWTWLTRSEHRGSFCSLKIALGGEESIFLLIPGERKACIISADVIKFLISPTREVTARNASKMSGNRALCFTQIYRFGRVNLGASSIFARYSVIMVGHIVRVIRHLPGGGRSRYINFPPRN